MELRHIMFDTKENSKLEAVILIKDDAFKERSLRQYYVKALEKYGVPAYKLFAVNLPYTANNKAPATHCREYISVLLPELDRLGITTIYVADANYFKQLVKVKRINDAYGYILPCTVAGYEHINCIYGCNYQALMYNEQLQEKLDLSIETLSKAVSGDTDTELGEGIIHSALYPKTNEEIREALELLKTKKELYLDIETFSLRIEKAGIGTIAFSWDKHNGVAFPVDYTTTAEESLERRKMLREFFDSYQGTAFWLFHGMFDLKILIFNLWMKDHTDFAGMRKGIQHFEYIIDDAQYVAFLNLNSTQKIAQDLKTLSYSYTGAYAEDVTDITQVPLDDLLVYNLKDCLGTAYVRETYWQGVLDTDQLSYYKDILMASVPFAMEMEMMGLPLCTDRLEEATKQITSRYHLAVSLLRASSAVRKTMHIVAVKNWEDANSKLKTKVHPLSKFVKPFNPNSDPQLAILLFEVLGLPVLSRTPTQAPSTSVKVIKRLLGMTTDSESKNILEQLVTISETKTIINTFLPAFENYKFKRVGSNEEFNGTYWLNGSIKLTGTQSGRMSSVEPNMTNLPSGSTYGHLVKSCFVAPKGWLFAGPDFSSLEDRINAIRTKDPNKIKIYTDGYDGHCLRAYAYFGDQMPEITGDTVDQINSIEIKYPALRQRSKAPTFALNYGGTHVTLVSDVGLSRDQAHEIEARYHELYKVSDEYTQYVISKASANGYITLAFGLRLRTPVLGRVPYGPRMPYKAIEEGRSAYNADSQSWGLLTNRAVIELRQRLLKAPEHIQNSILILNAIHDASYYLVRDDLEIIKWLNDNLIECMQWQESPEIASEDVLMEAELDFGYNWAEMVTLKNNASLDEIREVRNKLDAA